MDDNLVWVLFLWMQKIEDQMPKTIQQFLENKKAAELLASAPPFQTLDVLSAEWDYASVLKLNIDGVKHILLIAKQKPNVRYDKIHSYLEI